MRATNSNSTPAQAAPKKLSIQIKSKPSLPADYFAQTWDKLALALDAIRAHERNQFGFSELYTFVDNLCAHKLGPQTYVALYRNVDAGVRDALEAHWTRTQALTGGGAFLQAFAQHWLAHVESVKCIRLLFTVLDRNAKQMLMQDSVPASRSVWDMGLQIFKRHLIANTACLERIILDLLAAIHREREEGASPTEQSHYQTVLRMLFNLEMYASHFEPRFLAETREFYRAEAARGMAELSPSEYLRKCELRLDEETARAGEFLDQSTRKPLRTICEDTLVREHARVLVQRGLDSFLLEHRLEDLNRMYRLFACVSLAETMLLEAFAQSCKARGLALVATGEDTNDLVAKLLELKSKLDEICCTAFENNASFARAVRTSFESFLNAGEENKPAELIAKYIDRTLRASTTSQPELEAALAQSMTLFRFLQSKDVFEAFYKQCLAKRLLLGTSNSPDLERVMIGNLKTECGSSFTSKLEGMMRDIDQSKIVSQQFQAVTAAASASGSTQGVDSSVQVLSMGFWPTFPDSICSLPRELEDVKERFSAFYTDKHQGRVLHWVNSLGRCTLRFYLGANKWDLEVSLFQAVVLLQFNSKRTFTFRELSESTLISNEELVMTMSSLALGRRDQRVLVRASKGTERIFPEEAKKAEDAGGEEEDEQQQQQQQEESLTSKLCYLDDVYQVNAQWTSKRARLKINQIQIKETKKENEDAHKRVQGDRQHQIDAAIVRIMKSRKQLSHSLLVTELFKQLSFPAKPQDLKRRIESLIDREYLERDENDANVYIYMA